MIEHVHPNFSGTRLGRDHKDKTIYLYLNHLSETNKEAFLKTKIRFDEIVYNSIRTSVRDTIRFNYSSYKVVFIHKEKRLLLLYNK